MGRGSAGFKLGGDGYRFMACFRSNAYPRGGRFSGHVERVSDDMLNI